MPTTRNRWQQEVHQSPEPVTDDKQANQANTDKKRQTSPQRPSVSPAPELASDLQDDPNPRSPKRMRLSADELDKPKPDAARAPVPTTINPPSNTASTPQRTTGVAQPSVAAPVQNANPLPASSTSPMPPAQAPAAPPAVAAPISSTPNPSSTTPTIAHPPGSAPPRQGTVPAAPSAPSAVTPPPARGPPPPPADIVKRRLDNLPKLGELADQILSLLSKMPVLDALALDADLRLLSSGQQPSSPAPAEYQRLRALFDPIRNVYVTGFPFLITDHLAMKDPSQVAIIRKANQAMFCAAIFGGGIGQLALDQAFLDIFVPENGQLLKAQSSIWLELKTQGFMTAMRLKAAPPNQVMSDLFPAGIESRIVARHPVSRALAPSEQEFVARYEARRKILFDHITRNALPDLDQKFTYVELAREVANFLIKTYGTGHEPLPGKPTAASPAPGQPQTTAQGLGSNAAPRVSPVPTPQIPASIANLPSFDSGDFIELAARAAEIAMRGTASPTLEQAPLPAQPVPPAQADTQPQNKVQSDFQHYTPVQNGTASKPHVPLDPSNGIPHASQTAPTHVLYQQARMAEPAKSSTPGTPRSEAEASYQRRTWSEEEEKALMDGLDRVQGPHWANIMALHGPGGSLSEALKDRNQVQLKDKARNLKLFFLKNKIEVPYYLSTVTGTLESRAPGQVEKAESELPEQGAKESTHTLDGMPKQKVEDVAPGQDHPMTETKVKDETKDGVSNAGAAAGDMDDVEAMLAKAAAEAVKST